MKNAEKSQGSKFKRKAPNNSHYNLGMLDPNKCRKYYNDCKTDPIIYRSGLEKDFIEYCERNEDITRWASEPIKIKYFSRLDNRECNYYPDFIIQDALGHKTIVEVKPYEQVIKPKDNSNKWLCEQWIKNFDKWTAAKAYAQKNNMKFIIVTEKFFYG